MTQAGACHLPYSSAQPSNIKPPTDRLHADSFEPLQQPSPSQKAFSMPRSSTHSVPSRCIAFLINTMAAVKIWERARFSWERVLGKMHG